MIAATVFTSCPTGNRREAIIHANVGQALSLLTGSDSIAFQTLDDDTAGRAPTGLTRIKPNDPVIALGRAAHTALADFEKRSLIASGMSFDESDADGGEDLDRLIWSCVNTSKVVALGEHAWRSIQMLPLADRRFYDVPPLHMQPGADGRWNDGILVIDHDDESKKARDLVDLLRGQCPQVEYVGPWTSSGLFAPIDTPWTSDAFVHIHVGHHAIGDDRVRLVDSWYSQRLVLQLVPSRTRATSRSDGRDDLLVDDEVNGFRRATREAILACYEDVRCDVVLRRKLIDGGLRSVAPLVGRWKSIAEELSS